jgi:hypothetical protein
MNLQELDLLSNKIKKFSQKDYEEWLAFCEHIQEMTQVIPDETKPEKEKRIARLLKPENYGEFFEYYFPHYTLKADGSKIACAPYHTKIANTLISESFVDVVFEGHRGCAKSTHGNIGFPMRNMLIGEMNFMLLIGETEPKACRLLGDIQAEFEFNQLIINDFGKQVVSGSWADGEFQTKGGVYFSSLSLGQNPRGIRKRQHRPDYIVVDDVDNKRRCNNPRLIQESVEWITDDLMQCFGSERGRFLLVNNRIHKNSILVNILKSLPSVRHFQINALDKNGEPTWKAKYTKEYWDKKQADTTFRSFQREYMNNPIEDGKIFKAEWIQYKKMLRLDKYDALVLYGDLSYKETGDFKAMKLWGKIGREFHRIAVFCRQTSRAQCAIWLYDLYEDLKLEKYAVSYFIEGLFAMDEFVNDFDLEGDKRKYYIPVQADTRPKAAKFDRIEQISGFWERRNVFYNEAYKDCSDEQAELDQLLAFEKGSGAPDDAPDADAGAIGKLNGVTYINEGETRTGKRPKPNSNY